MIPLVLEESGGSERVFDIYSRLLRERIIFLGEQVTSETANRIVAQLLFLEAEDPDKDIYMYINSPGGSVYDGLGIFDTMQHVKPDIHTVCVGLAASMGAFLLAAGTKGKRSSLRHSRIMIHQPLGGARGQASDIRIQADEILFLKERLNTELSERTGKDYDTIKEDTDRDFYMSPSEAVEYGLIDLVLEKKPLEGKSRTIKPDLSPNDRFDFKTNNSNQTIIMMGDQTCSRRSSEYLPLKVLESYLSYGMSAALFKLFREKHGITYDLGVYYPIRNGNAPFLIYLSVSNKQALFAFELLSILWRNLLFKPLTDGEIFLAKEKLKGSFLLGNQSVDEILQNKIQLISYGISPISEIDLNSQIEEISSLDILKLTNRYFSKPFLSISGNEKICLEISKSWKKNF